MPSWLIVILITRWSVVALSPASFNLYQSICDLSVCQCTNNLRVVCVCDQRIQNLVLRGGFYLPQFIGSLGVDNCVNLRIEERSLERASALRSVTLTNIGTVTLEPSALSWSPPPTNNGPGIDIQIHNATIPFIPTNTFRGRINSVILDNVNVESVRALAFSDLFGMEHLNILNSRIQNFEPQAFKKFTVESLVLNKVSIDTLPSYSFIGITVTSLLSLESLRLGFVRSGALRVEGPKYFKFMNSIVGSLEGEALKIVVKGPVFVHDNVFHDVSYGAFAGITLDPKFASVEGKRELIFENNTLSTFADFALTFDSTGLSPKIDRIIINRPCHCLSIQNWVAKLVKYSKGQQPSNLGQRIWCLKDQQQLEVTEFETKHCSLGPSPTYWVASIIILVVLSLLLLTSIGFWLYRRHTKRYLNVPVTDANAKLGALFEARNNHFMVVPAGKTYHETELHVIEERVEPIKEYIPTVSSNQHS